MYALKKDFPKENTSQNIEVETFDGAFVNSQNSWTVSDFTKITETNLEIKPSIYSIKLIENTCSTDIFFRIHCPNLEFIAFCSVQIGDSEYQPDSTDSIQKIPIHPTKLDFYMRYKFTCPNTKILKTNK